MAEGNGRLYAWGDGRGLGTSLPRAGETKLEADVQQQLFALTDGGKITVRSRVIDDIWGPRP